jgi:hypothetical protein
MVVELLSRHCWLASIKISTAAVVVAVIAAIASHLSRLTR